MLILARRPGEEILIDKGRIQIKVICMNEKKVMLGITAPKHIDVDRKEVFLEKLLNQDEEIPQVELRRA